jgi:hypothetical protein
VVKDEDQVRHRGGRPGRGTQLAGRDDQVVDQAGPGDGGQAAQHVGPDQPVRVGFALDLVPQADQLRAAGHLGEGGDLVGDVGSSQVRPADHAGDQVAGRGQREQLRGLRGHGDGLHHDARGDAVPGGQMPVVIEQEIAAQRSERRAGDPVLVSDAQVPQMVVSVDDPHGGHSSQTTGSAAADPSEE